MPYSKSPPPVPVPTLSTADRKKQLLTNGALHRANILIARADIVAGVHPAALTRETLGHLSANAKALFFDTVRNTAMNPTKLSPLLMTGLSLLAKKSVRKPLMYIGVAGGAIVGAIYLVNLFRNNGEPGNPES